MVIDVSYDNIRIKNISVRGKILFYLLGFCGLLLIILWLFQVVFLDNFYQSIKVNNIKRAATKLSEHINSSQDMEGIIQELALQNEICVEIIDYNGLSMYGYDTMKNCIIHKLTTAEKLGIFKQTIDNSGELLVNAGDSFRNKRVEPKKEGNLFDINTPPLEVNASAVPKYMHDSIIYGRLVEKGAESYLILINANITPVNATVYTLRIQFIYIAFVMILLSTILAMIISRKVSSPIEKLNQGAKVLAEGRYDVNFDGRGYREIEELSDSLNTAATELSKVDKLQRELVANVSHDLRTPLTLITGYAEAMRDLPDELNKENVETIVYEAKRLTSLVNDVLTISKNQKETPLNIEKFDLTSSIEGLILSMSELLKNNGYNIHFVYEERINLISDESKISQAFYNLLINAVNYSGEDKEVRVVQSVKEGKVTIAVYDSGAGIAPEDAPYIWERYYTGKTHVRAITGSGLGLSIVKNTIEVLGGEYGFVPQEKGSMFFISFKL